MRVLADGPQRLVIEDRPWFNAGFVWLMGAVALGAALAGSVESLSERVLVGVLGCGALAAAWGLFPFQILVFERDGGQFTRTVRRLARTTTTVLALDQVIRAEIDREWLEASWMERLCLVTVDGTVALEPGYFSGSRAPVVAAINGWLQRTRA